jgi:hypothetical protein
MADPRFGFFLDAVPLIAKMFRATPGVAALFDPAVVVIADEDFTVEAVERIQLLAALSDAPCLDGVALRDLPAPDRNRIPIVVADDGGSTLYTVPDPRAHPELWPWTDDGDRPSLLPRTRNGPERMPRAALIAPAGTRGPR